MVVIMSDMLWRPWLFLHYLKSDFCLRRQLTHLESNHLLCFLCGGKLSYFNFQSFFSTSPCPSTRRFSIMEARDLSGLIRSLGGSLPARLSSLIFWLP